MRLPPAAGKLLYAMLFNLVLPAGLWGWACASEANVGLPSIHAPRLGLALLSAGLGLVAAGMAALMVWGRGLPMNAYPPPSLVARGVYRLLSNPIYLGFTLACAGAACWGGSASGLWLVAPSVGVSSAALWFGYERQSLVRRFGALERAPFFGLPRDAESAASLGERVGALLFGLVPAALAGSALSLAGLSRWPVASPEGLQALVATPAIFILLLPLAAKSRAALRRFAVQGWVGSLLVGLAVLALPWGPWGGALALSGLGALYGLVGLAAAAVWGDRLPGTSGRMFTWALFLAALLGSGALDGGWGAPALAFSVRLLLSPRLRLWPRVLVLAERIANSWREWRLGRARLISHGSIAAGGTGLGLFYAGVLAGPEHVLAVVAAGASAILGAALWAQLIEGSPALARPFGFFGGLLAIILFGLVLAPILGTPSWLLLGVFCTAGPWIQGLGRLRCLANGCCHGAPCEPRQGIRYHHPMTRVVRLAGLGGQPIYPTQLYSLLANAVIGILLMRLWAEGAQLSLSSGLYLVLMGATRFVEEAFRGEPQTPEYFGLRLYQWIALLCVGAGAVVTSLPGSGMPPPAQLSWEAAAGALLFAALVWLVASVDFPRSVKRLARLA